MWLAQFAQSNLYTYDTTPTTGESGLGLLFGGTYLLVWLVVLVVLIVSYWKLFTKAGEPGWYSIIPIWNTIVLLKLIGKEWYWIIGFFIPFVNIIVLLYVSMKLAKAFGKSDVWGIIMLFFLGIIGYPILAFSSAKYLGPEGGAQS